MESGLDLRASEKRRRRIIDFVLCWGVEQQKSRERASEKELLSHAGVQSHSMLFAI
jgi:hypothetical protein